MNTSVALFSIFFKADSVVRELDGIAVKLVSSGAALLRILELSYKPECLELSEGG